MRSFVGFPQKKKQAYCKSNTPASAASSDLLIIISVTVAAVVLAVIACVVLIIIAAVVLVVILVIVLIVVLTIVFLVIGIILSLIIRHDWIPPVEINKLHPYYFTGTHVYSSIFSLLSSPAQKTDDHQYQNNHPEHRRSQYGKRQMQQSKQNPQKETYDQNHN